MMSLSGCAPPAKKLPEDTFKVPLPKKFLAPTQPPVQPPAVLAATQPATVLAPTQPSSQPPATQPPAVLAPAVLAGTQPAALPWPKHFKSALLETLIEEALSANRTLRQLAFQVEGARALLISSGTEVAPQFSLDTTAARHNPAAHHRRTEFSLAGNFRWEIDLWGRLKNLREVSKKNLERQSQAWKFARLSLAANVAKTYFTCLNLKRQLDLNQAVLRLHETEVKNSRQDYALGTGGSGAYLLAQSAHARAQADLSLLHQSLHTAREALDLLLARVAFQSEVPLLGDLPQLSKPPQTGLPIELLSRRADIVALKRLIEAALQAEQAASKQWLPTLSFASSLSQIDKNPQALLSKKPAWNFALQFQQAVLDGDKIKGDVHLARAQLLENIAAYQALVLEAFGQAQLALMHERQLKAQIEHLENALESSKLLAKHEQSDWLMGVGSFQAYRNAALNRLSLESQLQNARFNHLDNRLNLYLALGGGFNPLP